VNRSETTSHDVLRDEILADAQRQATRLIRKAQRDAQSLIDKARTKASRNARPSWPPPSPPQSGGTS